MKTLARNGSNDIFLSGRGLAFCNDADARCEILESFISTQVGELQFDENGGVDYFGTVFRNPRYISLWKSEVETKVKEFSWVSDVIDFTYEFNRKASSLTWTMRVVTTDGDTLNLSSHRKNTDKTELNGTVLWSDITNKPDGIDEAMDALRAMKKTVDGELVGVDDVDEIKRRVNATVLVPFGAKDNDESDNIAFLLSSVTEGAVLFGSETIEVETFGSWYVDYGDGTVIFMRRDDKTVPEHTYEEGGDYKVSINGSVTGLSVTSQARGAGSSWKGFVTRVFIGENSLVNKLGTGMFSCCSRLVSVDVKSKIESVGEECFSGCVSLTGIEWMPSSVSAIGAGAFEGCVSITSPEGFPSGITEVPARCFKGCSSLRSFVWTGSDKVMTIGEEAFFGCSAAKGLVKGFSDLKVIGDRAFAGCTGISEFVLWRGLERIGYSAFSQCIGLERLSVLANAAPSAKDDSFDGVREDADVSVIGNLETYAATGWRHFSSIRVYKKTVFRLEGVPRGTYIYGYGTLSSNSAWIVDYGDGTQTLLSNGVTRVPTHKYSNGGDYDVSILGDVRSFSASRYSFPFLSSGGNLMPYLTKVSFSDPSSVTTIGEYAFNGCTSLREIASFPASVSSIGDYAFAGTGIADLEFLDGCQVDLGVGVFSGCADLASLIGFPRVSKLPAKTFQGCVSLETLDGMPSTITSVGANAFDGCSSLRSLEGIPQGVESMESFAFARCVGLTGLAGFPGAMDEIPSAAFYGCTSVESLQGVGNGVKKIGDYAFYECTGLALDDLYSVESIGEYAFYGCDSIEKLITKKTSVVSIGAHCFEACSSLCSVVLGEEVSSIGESAFSGTALEEIVCDAFNPPSCSSGTFDGLDDTIEVTVPLCSVSAYGMAEGWRKFSSIVGSGIEIRLADVKNGDFIRGGTGKVVSSDICRIDFGDGTWQNITPQSGTIPSHTYNDDHESVSVIICGDITNIEATSRDFPFIVVENDGAVDPGTPVSFKVTKGMPTRTIGERAFEGCETLEAVSLENEVSYALGSAAFGYCEGIQTLTLPGTPPSVPEASVDDPFLGVDIRKIEVSVPSVAVLAYVNDGYWGKFNVATHLAMSLSFDGWRVNPPQGALECIGKCKVDYGDGTVVEVSEGDGIPEHVYADYSSHTITISGCVIGVFGGNDGKSSFLGSYADNPVSITSCSISEGMPISTIGKHAFRNCGMSDLLWMPGTVTDIGVGAFSHSLIASLEGMSSKVVKIPGGAFSGCPLTNLVGMPDSVTSIESEAFYRCSLVSLSGLSQNVKDIGESAFAECRGLVDLSKISRNLESLGLGAFRNCKSLSSLRGLEMTRIVEIPDQCFFGTGISSLEGIPQTVLAIGDSAFCGCINLTSLIGLPSGLREIGSSCFSSTSLIGLAGLPATVTVLGEECFLETKIRTLDGLPSSLTYLPALCFYGCSLLKEIVIPSNIARIEHGCFCRSGIVGRVTLPASLEYVGSEAFAATQMSELDIRSLHLTLKDVGSSTKTIWCNTENPPVINISDYEDALTFGSVDVRTIYFAVPEEYTARYASSDWGVVMAASESKAFVINADIMEDVVRYDGGATLSYSEEGNHYAVVEFPQGHFVMSAQDGTSVRVPSCEGFAYTSSFEVKVYVSPAPQTITGGIGWFSHKVDTPDGWERIETSDGRNEVVKSVTFDYDIGLTGISGILNGCKNVEDFTIPGTVKEIGSETFSGCLAMESVCIPSKVEYIGYKAFYGCTAISSIEAKPSIPPSLASNAFSQQTLDSADVNIPKESFAAYRDNAGWGEFKSLQVSYPVEYNRNTGIASVESEEIREDGTIKVSVSPYIVSEYGTVEGTVKTLEA